MNRSIAKFAVAGTLGLVCVLAIQKPCAADVVFSDSTFNLANYSQISFLSNPSVPISTSQILAGGNPGAAVQIVADVPANTAFQSMQGFANNSFTFDPATQGALLSVDASVDKEFNTDLNLATNSFRPLILQGGKYYTASIALPATKNVFLSGSQTGLVANDFSLFDFSTGLFDATQHPDFTGPVLEFGLSNRLTQTANASTNHDDIRYDNLVLTLHTAAAVPLPPAWASACVLLFAAGGRFLFRRCI